MKKVNPIKWTLGFLFVLGLIATLVVRDKADLVVLTGKTMGTTYSIKYINKSKTPPAQIVSMDIEKLLLEVNRQMSTWQKDSEISLFNKNKKKEWVKIPDDFYYVLSLAIDVASKTDGLFDPTIGPLVNLWGFGPNGERKVPSKDKIEQAMKRVGYQKIQMDSHKKKIKKTNPEVYLDLSASAKGFGVDVVSKHLKSLGYTNHMVEIGGEVRTSGKKFNKDWTIAIEVPSEENKNVAQKTLNLKDLAIATSGSYRNFFKKENKRYSHAINFRTGKPIAHTLASVSVVHGSCLEADSWATALMVMGVDKGLELAEKLNLAAYFVYRPSGQIDGSFVEKSTTAFEKLFGKSK
ncbi:MAG: FAD:protein FMN transferase [Bacteriovoracaceae bacterium]|nr:FAD:protein FMN transferase [Bacteriovoracaceae bacterium]